MQLRGYQPQEHLTLMNHSSAAMHLSLAPSCCPHLQPCTAVKQHCKLLVAHAASQLRTAAQVLLQPILRRL
jgi:hypothetical protein